MQLECWTWEHRPLIAGMQASVYQNSRTGRQNKNASLSEWAEDMIVFKYGDSRTHLETLSPERHSLLCTRWFTLKKNDVNSCAKNRCLSPVFPSFLGPSRHMHWAQVDLSLFFVAFQSLLFALPFMWNEPTIYCHAAVVDWQMRLTSPVPHLSLSPLATASIRSWRASVISTSMTLCTGTSRWAIMGGRICVILPSTVFVNEGERHPQRLATGRHRRHAVTLRAS